MRMCFFMPSAMPCWELLHWGISANISPDTDPSYKGIASSILLRRTVELIKSKGYEIGNIDSTICLQSPKIKSYIPEMRQQIAALLQVDAGSVSVKATTEEKLGFTGREEGVSAYAVVLIRSGRQSVHLN